MCGADSAVCLHGTCVVMMVDGAAVERCQCDAPYSGTQCSRRDALLYFELPVACALVLALLVAGALLSSKVLRLLRFPSAQSDVFTFPRQWQQLAEIDSPSLPARLFRGTWSGPSRKGLPWKPTRHHIMENMLVTIVTLLELVPWIQLTALAFLPVVPWPKASRPTAELLRLALLHPLWTHLEASSFPLTTFYASLGFVPGILLIACVVGAKRFPLFKPQPKSAPAEDLCTLLLRLYTDWLALPVMVGLLLPLECGVIGYSKTGTTEVALPALDESCFTLLQIGYATAGVVMLTGFWFVNCAIAFQLNCESSPPSPTLWTHVQYTRLVQVLKAPLAMGVVGSVNANGTLLCICCILTSLVLGVMNARMKPCILSLVNGVRVCGAVMSLWSGLLGLTTVLIDDPGVDIVYEVWSLGAIAISAISFSSLLLYHTEDFWFNLVANATNETSGAASTVSKSDKGGKPAAKVGAVGFRTGIPGLLPSRRSSVAEKLRSRAKRTQSNVQ